MSREIRNLPCRQSIITHWRHGITMERLMGSNARRPLVLQHLSVIWQRQIHWQPNQNYHKPLDHQRLKDPFLNPNLWRTVAHSSSLKGSNDAYNFKRRQSVQITRPKQAMHLPRKSACKRRSQPSAARWTTICHLHRKLHINRVSRLLRCWALFSIQQKRLKSANKKVMWLIKTFSTQVLMSNPKLWAAKSHINIRRPFILCQALTHWTVSSPNSQRIRHQVY